MSWVLKQAYKYRYELLLFLAVIFLLFVIVFRDKIYNSWLSNKPKLDFFNTKLFSTSITKKKSPYGKYENRCREIFEHIFNKKFPKVRPDFLRRPNGRCLELDGYNDELKLAFEYNGYQHYKFSSKFHKNMTDLEDQIQRDIDKKEMCRKHGIELIEIPYNIKYENLYAYILKELNRLQTTLHPMTT